ncbi:peptidoglycan recognition protein 3-like [Ruditapes philippinarum]|uniref:peptidoglycan recognition protein 3-like n=1 Tax=Ruditapes philippinarum TaxID=129788 RepID=UPI00295A6964|nr:peptidoglycan recognition protein 3-like [Ruditapes philippinarum]
MQIYLCYMNMDGLRIIFLLLCLQMTQGCFRSGFTSDRELTESGSDTSNNVEDEPVTDAPEVGTGGNNEPVTDAPEVGTGGNNEPETDDDENNVNDETPTWPGCPSIITRSQWGARAAKSTTPMTSAPMYVVIHHGAGTRCFTPEKCQEIVRDYQNLHMDTRKWSDIGYNFIVGEDGNVYEGRGWGIRGAHAGTSELNKKSLGICVIGDFSNNVPNEAAQNAVKQLITCSKSNDKLLSTYTIRAHRDLKNTECPGQKFYDVIKTWSRYSESASVDAKTSEDGTVSVENAEIQLPGCPTIISRAGWGARAPKSRRQMSSLPSYALIHHGAGARCFTKSACTSTVQAYQKLHMDNNNWHDIGYNFIVGEDGNVYEGRGWGISGSHAGKNPYNSISLGICVIGDFSNDVPNEAAQTAIKQLLSCSVAKKKLLPSYTLRGHRDVKSTACPGTSFYNVIRTWNRY